MGLTDEVKDRQDALAFGPAETSTELLEEDRGTLGGSQEQDRVDLGDVDALVEDVDSEDGPKFAAPELAHGIDSIVSGSNRRGGQPQAGRHD